MGPINNVSECIGLWLAEGDTKSKYEITFTNNNMELIKLFYKTIKKLLKIDDFRLYVYSSSRMQNLDVAIKRIRFYKDKRARKPYFILRLANRDIVMKWHRIVNESIKESINYRGILHGFFAGEGSIKGGLYNCRQIRIAQVQPNHLIEHILKYFKVNFSFSKNERNYVISGRDNWEKLYKLQVADLHSDKKTKFMKFYSSFKQWHYPRGYLKSNIYEILKTQYTTRQLSKIFGRSFARIEELLVELKKEDKITNFRVSSIDYWIRRDENKILISKRKEKILRFTQEPKTTQEISDEFNVCWKAAFRRLNELSRLGLVTQHNNKEWVKNNTNKEVIGIESIRDR